MSLDPRMRRAVGGAVWLVGFGVAAVWGALDLSAPEGVGYGFAPPVDVAPLEAGRVLDLPVRLHDAVAPDQVLVRMDPQPIVEERAVATAQLLAIQAQEAAVAMTTARRFAERVEGMAVSRAQLAAQLQEDLATADTIREKLAIEEDLAGRGASSSQAVAEWGRQLRVVQARIDAGRAAVAAVVTATDRADARNDAAPGDNAWAVVAATREVERLDGRISRTELTAGIEGQVTWIYKGEGDVVAAGTPVLQVRRTGTREVVGFFAPTEVAGIEAGESATVRRATGQVLRGHLRSVGSGPQPLPVHLWKLPTWPEYGVPVVVELDDEIAPDEPVVVRL